MIEKIKYTMANNIYNENKDNKLLLNSEIN